MAKVSKKSQGHGYKYADLATVNEYIEELGEEYVQEIETASNGFDYIVTIRIKDGKEIRRCRGCKVPEAKLPQSKANPAQEYGSGLTYARRYSLYMAYGLATEDDDAESFTVQDPAGYQSSPMQQPAYQQGARGELFDYCNKMGIALQDVAEQYDFRGTHTDEEYAELLQRLKKDVEG